MKEASVSFFKALQKSSERQRVEQATAAKIASWYRDNAAAARKALELVSSTDARECLQQQIEHDIKTADEIESGAWRGGNE